MRITRAEAITLYGQPDKNGHITRFSDASTFDEICVLCGARDNPIRFYDADTLEATQCSVERTPDAT